MEVLSAADGVRRRHWPDEDKPRIVEESFIGHRQTAATARRHGICRSLRTPWCRQYRDGELGNSCAASFSPVAVAKDIAASQQKSIDPIVPTRDCQVEIALLNGRRLIVPTRVDPEALARLLSVVDDQ
ncbi:transposase [Pseudoruegeria sp. SK021]|nr:transposase [Pseudoruegeria sp. SK021]